jgi:histidinol-phosphate phosphatase family protein
MNKNIVIIMGYPASGKTVLARKYEERGYRRINRDELGGSLDGLVQHVERENIENGISQFVMDNTYPTVESRQSIIKWALDNNFEIHCKYIDIDVGDALYNASKRLIDIYGRLLTPEEIKKNKEVGIYPPVVIYKYRKTVKPPKTQEGFNTVEKVKFSRVIDKTKYTKKAIILDYDGTIRKTKSGARYPSMPEDIEILPHRTEVLKEYQENGYILLGVSNQSFVAKGDFTLDELLECFAYTHKLLGINFEYHYCPHPAFPQICYCRKPMPGMGVEFIEKYKLDPSQCIMVGDMKVDNTFANRCGFQFIHAEDFFKR